MRRFVDLRILPETGKTAEMLSYAKHLGYSAVGCGGDPPSESPIDVISRLDIAPRSQQDLQRMLKGSRRKHEVISVLCLSKGVARQAAKDSRVDLLRFPMDPSMRRAPWFDRQQASLAGEGGCHFEVVASVLLNQDSAKLGYVIKQLRKEVLNARRYDVPVVLSSGAESVQGMRDPRSLAALMNLVGLGEEESLDLISENPWVLVERNRDKLSASYVSPGVRVMDS
jgi:ribonuclease P/MRP protein subunit RPP1